MHGRWGSERGAGGLEQYALVAIGDDPEMPDAIEAARQHVETEATQELLGVERQGQRHNQLLEPNPRVILVPSIGLFTTGKDRRTCRIAHDSYLHTMRVIADALSINAYCGLSNKHLFDFEYWPLETYELALLPPEKEMSRRIVTDVNAQKLRDLSAELNAQSGEENTVAIPMDVTDEGSVASAFREAILDYGGLDILVSDAGIARSIWSKSMRQGRAKAYGIPLKDLDAYCITRNLLKVKVTAQDVAEAVLFLAADCSAKTTGAKIPVDRGIKEAFPR